MSCTMVALLFDDSYYGDRTLLRVRRRMESLVVVGCLCGPGVRRTLYCTCGSSSETPFEQRISREKGKIEGFQGENRIALYTRWKPFRPALSSCPSPSPPPFLPSPTQEIDLRFTDRTMASSSPRCFCLLTPRWGPGHSFRPLYIVRQVELTPWWYVITACSVLGACSVG